MCFTIWALLILCNEHFFLQKYRKPTVIFYVFQINQNVQMGGMVSTVATNAQSIVEPTLHVIT